VAGILTTRVVPTSVPPTWPESTCESIRAGEASIGIVSQQNTLDRQLTVWENLYFHGRLFGINAKESRRRADELLERFSLSKWSKASVYALSGGMASVSWWRAPSSIDRAVLFLDEPTAGLDPRADSRCGRCWAN